MRPMSGRLPGPSRRGRGSRTGRGSGTGPILLSQATFVLAHIANSGPVPLAVLADLSRLPLRFILPIADLSRLPLRFILPIADLSRLPLPVPLAAPRLPLRLASDQRRSDRQFMGQSSDLTMVTLGTYTWVVFSMWRKWETRRVANPVACESSVRVRKEESGASPKEESGTSPLLEMWASRKAA